MVCTFPGVYHGGFSPTFNVCEAVNMATVDWVDTGLHQMRMNAKEGYPRKSCFSLEWMLAENMKLSERLDFSPEAKAQLAEQYRTLIQEEIAARERIRISIESEELWDPKKVKYFELMCSKCRNYTYLSVMGCRTCQTLWCLRCEADCACKQKQLSLFIRSTDRELLFFN